MRLTDSKSRHVTASLHNDSTTFVTEHEIFRDSRLAYSAVFPEVHIGATNSCCANVDETLVCFGLGNIGLKGVEFVLGVGGDGDVGGLSDEDFCAGCHIAGF